MFIDLATHLQKLLDNFNHLQRQAVLHSITGSFILKKTLMKQPPHFVRWHKLVTFTLWADPKKQSAVVGAHLQATSL